MAGKESEVDWDSIEPLYRAGCTPLRKLAAEFGCSAGRISQVAKERGWEKDIAAKIDAKAEAKLNKSFLNKSLNAKQIKQKEATENDIVEANAQIKADAQVKQIDDTGLARTYVTTLLKEAMAATDVIDDLRKLGDLMAAPDDKGNDKLNEIYHKVISMPGRVDSGKKLVEALKVSVELERKVLRIKDDSPAENALNKMAEATMSAADAYKRLLDGPG